MPRNFGSYATDAFVRVQLSMVQALCDQTDRTSDDCRKALNLTEQEWLSWSRFRADGPLPAAPPLPEMLRRLAEVAFTLSMLVEERDADPGPHPPHVLCRSCLAYGRV